MTAAPLDLDALEALEKAARPGPWTPAPRIALMGHDATLAYALRNAAPALIQAARSLATYERMDREAATHVESVICMRTDFAEIDPTESGWKGLGAALNRALDERDASRAEIARLREALEAAKPFIEDEVRRYDERGTVDVEHYADEALAALAKARAALGREGTP